MLNAALLDFLEAIGMQSCIEAVGGEFSFSVGAAACSS